MLYDIWGAQWFFLGVCWGDLLFIAWHPVRDVMANKKTKKRNKFDIINRSK
jgi:hypothetical protein